MTVEHILTTRFGYDYFNVINAVKTGIRRGHIDSILYFMSELDLSGFSGSVWMVLMDMVSGDIGLAVPKAPLYILSLYKMWKAELSENDLSMVESYNSPEAIYIYLTAGKLLGTLKKSSLVRDANIISSFLENVDNPTLQKLDDSLKNLDECLSLEICSKLYQQDKYQNKINKINKKIWGILLKNTENNELKFPLIKALYEISKIRNWDSVHIIHSILLITRELPSHNKFDVDEDDLDSLSTTLYISELSKQEFPEYSIGEGIDYEFNIANKLTNIGFVDEYEIVAYQISKLLEGGKNTNKKDLRKLIIEKVDINDVCMSIKDKLEEENDYRYNLGSIRIGGFTHNKKPMRKGYENILIAKIGTKWTQELHPSNVGPIKDEKTGLEATNLVNWWEFQKVYKKVIRQRIVKKGISIYEWPEQRHAQVNDEGNWIVLEDWYKWRDHGFQNEYPIYKPNENNRVLFVFYDKKQLNEITARKEIYIPIYKKSVRKTKAFKKILRMLLQGDNIMLIDENGPDIEQYPEGVKMTEEKIDERYNDDLPLGHSYILVDLLMRELKKDKYKNRRPRLKDLRLASEKNGSGPTMTSHWIVPNRILAGAYPGDSDQQLHTFLIDKIIKKGKITVFVDLMEEGEQDWKWGGLLSYKDYISKKYKKKKIRYLHLPIKDAFICEDDELERMCDLLIDLYKHGENIYIHCYAGVGRTGSLISLFIGRCLGLNGKEALQENQKLYELRDQRRPNSKSPPNKVQRGQIKRILKN